MMREDVAPALRELGFKGSGQSFSLPSDRYWALVGFQKSAYSDATAVKFTVNLRVVSKEDWERAREAQPWRGQRPSPNDAGSVPGGWYARIGQLLPSRADQWWRVDPDTPTEQTAQAVVAAIRDFGLPEMRRRMT